MPDAKEDMRIQDNSQVSLALTNLASPSQTPPPSNSLFPKPLQVHAYLQVSSTRPTPLHFLKSLSSFHSQSKHHLFWEGIPAHTIETGEPKGHWNIACIWGHQWQADWLHEVFSLFFFSCQNLGSNCEVFLNPQSVEEFGKLKISESVANP